MLALRGLCSVMLDSVLVCNTTNACPKALIFQHLNHGNSSEYRKQMENYKLLARLI